MFVVGADGFHVPDFVCDIYFQSQKPCLGGVLALNGATGAVLWKHYAPHEVFAVNCIADLNKDNTSDCVIAGRAAVSSCSCLFYSLKLTSYAGFL